MGHNIRSCFIVFLISISFYGCSKKIPEISFEDLAENQSAILMVEADTYNGKGAFSVQVGELQEDCKIKFLFEKKLKDMKEKVKAKLPPDKDIVIQTIYMNKYYNYFQGRIKSSMQDAVVVKTQAKRQYVVRLEVPKKHFREIKFKTLTMSGEETKAKESERYKGCM